MKKAIAMFMAVSMAAAMLVGCGDNSADGESTAASPTTEAAEKKTEGSSNSEVDVYKRQMISIGPAGYIIGMWRFPLIVTVKGLS